MSVRINLEIGHEAALRSKRTIEGYTHDWEIYIKGCDNADIHYYIEKVVFHLHNTFTNPKRVVKEPPYRVRESGYAGFSLPIEIYLRNNEEPKKIRFTYDLNLQTTGPVVKFQKEKYVFYNPNEDFRRKLMKGGAVESGSSSDSSAQDNSINEKLKQVKTTADLVKKHRVKEHKAEDSFRDLFGTPITKTSKIITEPKPPVKPPVELNNQVKIEKNSNPKKSKSKHSPKDKERDKEKKDKNPEEKKKHKEEKKSKERSKDKERKDKSGKQRDKSPKQPSESPTRSPKQQRPPSPSPKRPPSPPPIKIKEEKKDDILKDKLKSESKKSRHEQKDKDKEKKEHKSHKEKDVIRNSEQKEHKTSSKEIKPIKEPSIFKTKEKPVKEEPPILIKEEKLEKPKFEKNELDKPEKQKHKHKKKDSKEKKEKKEEKIKDKKSEKKLDKSEFFYKEEPKVSTSEIDKNSMIKPQETSPDRNNIRDKSRALTALQSELQNDSSNSSIDSVEDPIEIPPKIIPKESKKKDKIKSEINEKKRKRKLEETAKEETQLKQLDEPSAKLVKNDEEPQVKHEVKPDEMSEEEVQEMPLNYMNMLRELQQKIMTLQDNNELQQVVQLIAETGQFEITAQTFDFDLCTLDRNTVQKLQQFFAIS